MSEVIEKWSATPEVLSVEWANGAASEFASVWLRDNLAQDRDPHSGQRLTDIADLPANPRIRAAQAQNGCVHVQWEDEAGEASFDVDWLRQYAASAVRAHAATVADANDAADPHFTTAGHSRPELATRSWLTGAGLVAKRDFAWLGLPQARADSALRLEWLTRLLQDGIAFLSGVPCADAAILEVMPLVGRVLETNYGAVFDVRSVPQPENLAYSDHGLGLHTDNPYRDPVPGFQALHVLISSPDGGDSSFADGLAIAEELRRTSPEAFAVLTRIAVPFLYRSKDSELYAERPLIQLSCNGRVAAVHYNSRSIAPLRLAPADARTFYAAYRRFGELLRDPSFQLRLKLNDGELVVFDNQRTLHGRTAFSSAKYPRHLRGCYLTRDSVFGEAALLRRKLAAGAA